MDVQTEMIEVPPSGGMTCFIARPTGAARAPGILVIQEAFGLNGHIQDVARRIAAEGYVALAPDLYWRAGQRRTVGYDQIGEAIALMQGVSDKDIVADVGSAIGYLERQPFVRSDRIGITGFCMGGRVSYLAACELPEKIKASAPFYGGGIPIDKTPKLRAPVLDSVEQLKAELARTGKRAEVIVYPGADHGFFCDERASYQAEAARDAWERLKRFFAAHLQG